jgi:hypothetical protein
MTWCYFPDGCSWRTRASCTWMRTTGFDPTSRFVRVITEVRFGANPAEPGSPVNDRS